MGSKIYYVVSGGIFGLVALAHLARTVYQVPLRVGSWDLPTWLSWGAFLVAGALCVWAFRLLRR
jgi:hypothetical protein